MWRTRTCFFEYVRFCEKCKDWFRTKHKRANVCDDCRTVQGMHNKGKQYVVAWKRLNNS